MDFEVEFHPVGSGSRAGDAITVRYLSDGIYKVLVIDGGTDESGAEIVEHIKSHYGSDTVISDVVSTHPDTDHSCGLRAVLKAFRVERLWVHGLWHHAEHMVSYFEDSRWTVDGLAKRIRSEYPVIDELIQLAWDADTEVYEPFAGLRIGPFIVLSPTREIYRKLVPQFRKTPEANSDLLRLEGFWLSPKKGIVAALERLVEAAISLRRETWEDESLKDGGLTAAENESSTVLLGQFGDETILLTADAGTHALSWANSYALAQGFNLRDCRLIQVPHHGSRRNVGPSILNHLLGPILPRGSVSTSKLAVVSAPKDDSKHPRRVVVNAFTRRGVGVRKTQGGRYRYHSNMPARPGESKAKPFEFFDEVEDYD